MARNTAPRRGIKFFSENSSYWNFGDALSNFFLERLLYRVAPDGVDIRLIGSTIFDGMVPIDDVAPVGKPWRDGVDTKIVYWGCGVREPGGLCEDARECCDFAAVRGPLSAAELRLGSAVPQGEPGLLLQALYQPLIDPRYAGKSVCIPHYNDTRSDMDLLTLSGCEIVLRPNIRKELAAVHEFIDAVFSASFVLSAALHGAITAVSYGRPFAFWDSGSIDAPFKWKDFAALVNISDSFAINVNDGVKIYNEQIKQRIIQPSMWSLVLAAPLPIRPEGLIALISYELSLVAEEKKGQRLAELLQEARSRAVFSQRVVERLASIAPAEFASTLEKLEASQKDFDSLSVAFDESRMNISTLETQLSVAVGVAEESAANVSRLTQLNEKLNASLGLAEENILEAAAELERAQYNARCLEQQLKTSVEAQSLMQSAIDASMLESLEKDQKLSQTEEVLADTLQRYQAAQSVVQASTETNLDNSAKITLMRGELQGLNARVAALKSTNTSQQIELWTLAPELSRKEGLEEAAYRNAEKKIKASRATSNRIAAALGFGDRAGKRLSDSVTVIEAFLDEFGWPLVGITPEFRRKRILQYVIGATESLPDFPFLNNADYCDMYPDVQASRVIPLVHFIKYGRFEKRNVHPLFNTKYYLEKYPEAEHLASCPAVHYLQWGAAKGYNPHPLFNTTEYFRRYPDVRASGRNPFLHWLSHPMCIATPLFDTAYYLTENPDVARAGRNGLSHFLLHGWKEGRNSHPLFRTKFYLEANPDVRAAGENPLVHYVVSGFKERRRASLDFDPIFYTATYPDITTNDIDPLSHYIEHGISEGRFATDSSNKTLGPKSCVTKPICVMIDAFYPRPDKDSGSLDQMSFAQIFQSLGFEVHFISILEFALSSKADTLRYARSLENSGVKCITSESFDYIESYFFTRAPDISLIFGSRVNFGGAYLSIAKDFCPGAKFIFNTVDLHFVREQRQALIMEDEELLSQSEKTKASEIDLASWVDATIVVSNVEKSVLSDAAPSADVFVVPLIRELSKSKVPAFGGRKDIAFIGGFQHQPNRDAVDNFLNELWPLLYDMRPDIRLRVIGADMPKEMQDRQVSGVDFVGFVEDLDSELDGVRLTIAPLRFGAGAKGKVVSSLRKGVPAVVSLVAAEGMGLTDNEQVLVSALDASYVERILQLYDDEHLWNYLSMNGRKFIEDTYSLEAGEKIMSKLLSDIGAALVLEKN